MLLFKMSSKVLKCRIGKSGGLHVGCCKLFISAFVMVLQDYFIIDVSNSLLPENAEV